MPETEPAHQEIKRQVLVTLGFLNLALSFSLALPTAGMINHLLPFGEPFFGRGLLIWLLLTLLCLGFSLLLVPWLRRRFESRQQRQRLAESEDEH